MEMKNILKLAERHGLQLNGEMSFNEMGIDFKVGFATDMDGVKWLLRIPRRDNLAVQIEKEKQILELVKKHLGVAVPDWKIASPELVAYPLLKDEPVITFDAETYEVAWNIDKENVHYVSSLAKVLVELHQIPIQEVASAGLKVLTPEMLRQEILERMRIVKSELGIGVELEARWSRWLDNDKVWPNFTAFIHGDLYAGHILTTKDGVISGVIDWSEGQVSDPSIDFAGHISVFGEESLKELINEYEKQGGRIWDKIFEQIVERHAATALNYGIFAIQSNSDVHIEAAKTELGLV